MAVLIITYRMIKEYTKKYIMYWKHTKNMIYFFFILYLKAMRLVKREFLHSVKINYARKKL
jgi:hypothetical protein